MNNASNNARVFVIGPNNEKLMPTSRVGKVCRMLKHGQAEVVCRFPFTIRLKYTPKTNKVQSTCLGIDPGRTNIGISVVREDGVCLYRAHVITRNKQIPKLMEKRKMHRQASRCGERSRKKRRAKKYNTVAKNRLIIRHIPGYSKPIVVKDIINTEPKFINRRFGSGWLTPTATQLLRTYLNIITLVKKILPVKYLAIEHTSFQSLIAQNSSIQQVTQTVCFLCGKRQVNQYHHVCSHSNGGSNSNNNVVGLCSVCHNRVHKNYQLYQTLLNLHSHSVKKFGSQSIMGQIMPRLINELKMLFFNNIYITTGKKTDYIRNNICIDKTHENDAYIIALTPFDLNKAKINTLSVLNAYEIVQFRRQNRALINHQTERTYKLDGVIVAKNRRKRIDQFDDSLHEWYIKMKALYGKKGAKCLQSRLVVIKSKRYHYSDIHRIMPGSVFKFDGKLYILRAQHNNGSHYLAYNQGNKNFPSKKCSIILNNCGLVYVV